MKTLGQARLRAFRADSRTMVRELGFMQESSWPEGVPYVAAHLMLELSEVGTLRPSDIADRLQTDAATVSRTSAKLQARDWVVSEADPEDRRQRRLSLTPSGRLAVDDIHDSADGQVVSALELLAPDDVQSVLHGMHAYAKALRRARLQRDLVVRPIEARDDAAVQAIITTVMPEFGARGPGYAIHDPEVAAMSEAYLPPQARYWVVERAGRILGGCGFAPLEGGDGTTCELRKMYFRPELRGLGVGARLLRTTLDGAREAGFQTCYLETLERMVQARRLYESFGFLQLAAPLGDTGHFGCDAWYSLDLD